MLTLVVVCKIINLKLYKNTQNFKNSSNRPAGRYALYSKCLGGHGKILAINHWKRYITSYTFLIIEKHNNSV